MLSQDDLLEKEGIEKNGPQQSLELKVSSIYVSPKFRVLMSFLSFSP